MLPGWLQALANLGPLLLIISIGLAAFGFFRLMKYKARMVEEREEEERQRQALLKKLEAKIEKDPTLKNPAK